MAFLSLKLKTYRSKTYTIQYTQDEKLWKITYMSLKEMTMKMIYYLSVNDRAASCSAILYNFLLINFPFVKNVQMRLCFQCALIKQHPTDAQFAYKQLFLM